MKVYVNHEIITFNRVFYRELYGEHQLIIEDMNGDYRPVTYPSKEVAWCVIESIFEYFETDDEGICVI